ncbi:MULTISPECIES: hypothetical protein [unclassified Bartonella]|uniref:hypothetical protein n=1 Tax=unclassified Bartonella TaxID=2645622 RepID=UPI0035D0F42D
MTERVVIACLEKMFMKKYPPSDSKKLGGVMMQEWVVDKVVFLLHRINDSAVFLLHWISDNLTIAPIIATIVTGMVTLFVQQRSLKKQLKIFQRQTIASETQTAILLEDKKARDLGPYLKLKAVFFPQKYEGTLRVRVKLCIKNLTREDIMIRNIRISKKSPFKFVKNACPFVRWPSKTSGEHLVIKRTTPKLIALCPQNIKSNASSEFALNFFIIRAKCYTFLDFIISCRKPNSRNIANFTLDHTSIVNPEETFTVHFWASYPRSKDTYDEFGPEYSFLADNPHLWFF